MRNLVFKSICYMKKCPQISAFFEVFLNQKSISKTVFSSDLWSQQWKNNCIVSINFLAQKTSEKKNLFSNFFLFQEIPLKREIVVNFLPQKIMTKYGIVLTYSVTFLSRNILVCLQCTLIVIPLASSGSYIFILFQLVLLESATYNWLCEKTGVVRCKPTVPIDCPGGLLIITIVKQSLHWNWMSLKHKFNSHSFYIGVTHGMFSLPGSVNILTLWTLFVNERRHSCICKQIFMKQNLVCNFYWLHLQ